LAGFSAFSSRREKTFEDIVRKPSWMLPIVLTTILSIAVSFSIDQRINWREFMSQQIEKSPRAAQMSAEQKQQQIEGGAKFSPPSPMGSGFWARFSVLWS